MRDMTPSMMLTTRTFEDGEYETFYLMPLAQDCPYIEAYFHPIDEVLVVLNAKQKEYLEEDNQAQMSKLPKWHPHYIDRQEEIEYFIRMFAVNADEFDYKKYLKGKPVKVNEPLATLRPIRGTMKATADLP
jgi:hypothetical protein